MQTLSVDQLIGQKVGKYRIERLLGRGRLSAVYLAQSLLTRRTDALTLYIVPDRFAPDARQRFLTRFLKEASVVSALQHRHILPIYEYGEQAGHPYLVTPYMMNGSLADMIKRQGPHTHTDGLTILEQVAAGLENAHSRGHIHGTLKPANIVVNNDGSLQVAGFGLMHMLQLSGIERSNYPYAHLLSVAETFMIAPEYIAPEVVQGKSIDARSDIYALGAILYELLSGKPPFTGANVLDIALQHVKHEAPPLRLVSSDVPVGLSAVVNQALERDPERRFQQVNELVEAFAQVSCGVTGKLYSVATLQSVPHKNMPTGTTASMQPAMQNERQTTGSWQLVPPIVTGKLNAVNPAALPRNNNRQEQSLPSTTGQMQTFMPPTTTSFSQKPAMPNIQETPAQEQVAPQAQNREAMRSFDWWSMAGPPPASLTSTAKPGETASVRAIERSQPQEPLHLSNNQAIDWNVQPVKPRPLAAPRPGAKRRDAKLSRRKVVAMLAIGGAVAAGGFAAFNLTHAMQGGNQANMGAKTIKQQGTQPQAATGNNNTKMGNAPAQNGTVIGANNMAVNSSLDFINPQDHKTSLLIHLPNGNFVAYEKACTHQGVLVQYNPQLHLLVCPAHGAMFDPANGGKVVQGPATTPIAKVAVRVNSDGSITTG